MKMNQILYSGKTRKKPIIPIIAICLILIVFIFSLGFGLMNLGSDKILNGVVVANIDVSNMTKEEAIEAINKLYSSSSEKDLILTYGETKLTLSTDDIGFAYTDAAQLIEEAYSYGREGNIFKDNLIKLIK